MAITDTRLRMCTFPQGWDGAEIALHVLVAPAGNPLQPLDPGLLPFAQAKLKLEARLIPGLERLPRPSDVAHADLLQVDTPDDTEQVYTDLADEFDIDPAAPPAYVPPTKTKFLKLLTPSYMEASNFAQPRTEYAVTDNRYICALADGERPAKTPPKPPARPKWNAVVAMALRQPVLAEKLGLLYRTSVKPPVSFYQDGGWLYVTLHSTSEYFLAAAGVDFVRHYAARIPSLERNSAAPVFGAVLFPVMQIPPGGSFDEMLLEADIYNDGFARRVHTFQPDRMDYLGLARQGNRGLRPHEETALKLGWDDEQVVIWLNRQITDDPRNGSPAARDTPLGVRGFRVDVREAGGTDDWHSLVRMQGSLEVGRIALGDFDGELAIELAPTQLQGKRDGEYWLPPYFANWAGASLIAAADLAFKVQNQAVPERLLKPVGERDVPLKYGNVYQFRVRLTDLTGGGPGVEAKNEPPSAITTSRFRRFVPPGSLNIAKPVETPDGSLTWEIRRPQLGYPALLYTPLAGSEAKLLADAAPAAADGRLPGFPDPDVTHVRIDVAVRGLEFDPENSPGPVPRRRLFTAFREFDPDPEQPLDLTAEFEDTPDLSLFAAPAAAGPLKFPTARDLEIVFTPIARQDPAFIAGIADPLRADLIDTAALDKDDSRFEYFGKHAARSGSRHTITERRESAGEAGLFQDVPSVPLQGIFIRTAPAADVHLSAKNAAAGTPEQAPESAIQRLARQIPPGLDRSDTLRQGRPPRRLRRFSGDPSRPFSGALNHHLRQRYRACLALDHGCSTTGRPGLELGRTHR